MEKIMISGFSDEISSDFDEQLKVVTGLGMEYISLRTADGKSIADYTAKEVKEKLLPKLKEAGVRVSSLGSPIGKVEIGDEEGFAKQLVQLEELCRIAKVLDCRYIRIFSFYIPEGRNPEDYREAVIEKLEEIDAILNEKATGWKTSRMNKVDLAILRLAVYEIKWDDDVPVKVAINEAVELAKKFSGEEGPAFVNGVLAKIAD